MTNGELKVRIEELNAVAEHVPAGLLAARLLAAVEDAHVGDLRTLQIAARIEHDERERGLQVEELDELKDTVELLERRIRGLTEEQAPPVEVEPPPVEPRKAGPVEVFDPGIPTDARALAMPETPYEAKHEVPDEDLEEPAEEPQALESEPAEQTKTCKICKETKSRTEFYAGRAKCKECFKDANNARRRSTEPAPKVEGLVGITNEAGPEPAADVGHERRLKGEETQRAEEEKVREFAAARITVLPPAAPVPEPEEIRGPARPKAPERFCANGEECISTAQVGRPTRLTHGNKDRRCFACQEAEIGEKDGETMIVRHSAADQAADA